MAACIAASTLLLVASSAQAVEPPDHGTGWGALGFGQSVEADQPTPEPGVRDTTTAVPSDLNFLGFAGGFGSTKGGGPMVGAAATWRSGWMQVGLEADSGGAIFGYSYFGYGAVAGIGWRSPAGWQLDALAVGGIHHYEGFGRGLFSSDPGASATLPFAGLRFGPSYAFGSGSTHFAIGLLAFAESDLASRSVSYDYFQQDWFSASASPQSEARTVWTARAGLALRLGITHDLL